LLAEGELSEDERQKATQMIASNADRLMRLLGDIISISRIEAGKLELKPGIYPMKEIVWAVSESLRRQAESKGLSFEVKQNIDVEVKVNVDRIRFEQILVNLLDNAIKFTDSGRIKVKSFLFG